MNRAVLAFALASLAAGCGSVPRFEAVPLEGHRSPIVALAVSTDGKTVVTRGGDGTIRIWPPGGSAAARVARPEGLALAGKGFKVAAVEATDAPGLRRLAVPNDQLLALAADGSEVVASMADPPLWEELKPGVVRRFALAFLALPDGKPGAVWTFDERWGAPVGLAFSPAGRELAVAFSDAHIRIFARDRSQQDDLPTFGNRSKWLAKYEALPIGVVVASEARVVRALAFSPDGKTLAAAVFLPDEGRRCHLVLYRRGADGFIAERGELDPPDPERPPQRRIGELVNEDAPMISGLAFSPDGAQIACSGHVLTGRQKTVRGVVDTFGFKTAEAFGRAWVVAAKNGVIQATIDGELDSPIASVAYASADELVLGAFRSVRVWSLARRETVAIREMPPSLPSAYARDGVLRFESDEPTVRLVAPGPGGTLLATSGCQLLTLLPPPK